MMSGNSVIRWTTSDILHKESSLTDVVTDLSSAEFRDGYLWQTSTVCLYRFIGDCNHIPEQPDIHRHIQWLSTLVEVTNQTLCTTFVQMECLKAQSPPCGCGSRLSARWWQWILFSPVNVMLAMVHYCSSVVRGRMRDPLQAQTATRTANMLYIQWCLYDGSLSHCLKSGASRWLSVASSSVRWTSSVADAFEQTVISLANWKRTLCPG